jgi:hypothetical protein
MVAYADYLMVITPPDHIIKDISRYKRASVNVIGHFDGMHSSAQIVITCQTRCKPFLVQPAIEQMAARLSTMPPVELRINGFGFFAAGKACKSIFAAVEKTTQVDNWFKLLHRQLGVRDKNFMPHIIIARNIPVTAFYKLWPNFGDRAWSETFAVNSLTVLQRETFAEYCEWRVYKELFFANRLKEMF